MTEKQKKIVRQLDELALQQFIASAVYLGLRWISSLPDKPKPEKEKDDKL